MKRDLLEQEERGRAVLLLELPEPFPDRGLRDGRLVEPPRKRVDPRVETGRHAPPSSACPAGAAGTACAPCGSSLFVMHIRVANASIRVRPFGTTNSRPGGPDAPAQGRTRSATTGRWSLAVRVSSLLKPPAARSASDIVSVLRTKRFATATAESA